jgi:hypothetical protein
MRAALKVYRYKSKQSIRRYCTQTTISATVFHVPCANFRRQILVDRMAMGGTLGNERCYARGGSATGNRVWASWSPYGRPARHISTLAALSMTVRTAPFGRKIAAGAARSARHGVDIHPVSRPIPRPRFPVALPAPHDSLAHSGPHSRGAGHPAVDTGPPADLAALQERRAIATGACPSRGRARRSRTQHTGDE